MNTITEGELLQGAIDCSASPNYPAAKKDMSWYVSVAGKIGGASGDAVEAGDVVICIADTQGGTKAAVGTSFTIMQKNMIPSTVDVLRVGTNNTDFVTAKTLADQALTFGAATMGFTGTFTNTGTINATTFDTNVAAAGVTLAGTTLAADGTDVAIPITLTPKGAASILSIAGTAANPTYSFTSEADTGMFLSAANALGFSTAGTERWVINASGSFVPFADATHSVGSAAVAVQDVHIARGLKCNAAAQIGALGLADATCTMITYSTGKDMVTVITLTDYIIGPLAGAAAAKVLVPPQALFVFPTGAHVLLVTSCSLALTAAGTAQTPDVGLGSVAGDGSANATLNLSAAGAEDIMTGFTGGDTSTHAVVANGPVGATAGVLTGIALNAVGGVKNLFLNAAATWAADNTGNLTATGTIVIKWTRMTA